MKKGDDLMSESNYPEYRTRRAERPGHFGQWTKPVPFTDAPDTLVTADSAGTQNLGRMLQAAARNVSLDPRDGAGAVSVRIVIDYGVQQDEYTLRPQRPDVAGKPLGKDGDRS